MARLLLALCLLASLPARADTRLYTFPYDEPPAELLETGFLIPPEEVTVSLTFAGDCTLGTEHAARGASGGFTQTVLREGMEYPFRELRAFFAEDDATIVNLEGVLSDRDLRPAIKKYRFIGPTAFVGVLTEGNIECVGMANNHALDFGSAGRDDTRAALGQAGIACFDDSYVAVLVKDGVRVGFTGTVFGPGDKQWARTARQSEVLRALGCAAWVHTVHMGTEYGKAYHASQPRMAEWLAAQGVNLVVGCHPHIVQGVTAVGDMPVAYSLGNCCFGGNANPPDHDACLLRAVLTFTDSALADTALRLYPISVSGSAERNDYQPRRLSGEDAERVLEKMRAMSDLEIGAYTAEGGASVALP